MSDAEVKFELFKRACKKMLPHPNFQRHVLSDESPLGQRECRCFFIKDGKEMRVFIKDDQLGFDISDHAVSIAKELQQVTRRFAQ